jgi:hypothetical protein
VIHLATALLWKDMTPRIHDLHHTVAVRRLLRWYEEGCDD